MNFKFGLDPEFMLIHHNESSLCDGLKSAIDILPNKDNAIVKNGHSFYFDNVLAEIAVKPSKNKDEAISNIRSALHNLAKIIKPAKFIIRASGNYPKKELNCADAKIAGCNSEWNVYSLQEEFPPDEHVDQMDGYYQFKTPFRSAGGHIHIGRHSNNSEHLHSPEEVFAVIKMMDLFLAIPSIFLDTDETSKNRRKIYGHAGTHRITDYGLEYRSLGNFWLSSPEHVALIYDLTEFVINFVDQKKHEKFWSFDEELLDDDDPTLAYSCFGYDVNMLRDTINNCNKKEANKFMTFLSSYLPIELMTSIEKMSNKYLPDPYVAWSIE
jgi:hypothetical protein